jgi:hypothetical protein
MHAQEDLIQSETASILVRARIQSSQDLVDLFGVTSFSRVDWLTAFGDELFRRTATPVRPEEE